ncbi:MAG: tetratricopeptide repeat protein, partial [Thermodesulfobacteriota bacterium]
RLGECAFQAVDAARARSAYETALEKINERMAPLAPARSFDRLHRLTRDRILAPALQLSSLEERARSLAQAQAEISAEASRLAESAAAPPNPAWTPYENGIQRLLNRQETLNKKLAGLAEDLNRICAAGKCRAYMESPAETLRLMTKNIASALSLPESLVALKAEMTDRLGLACQELEEWEAAIDAFESVFDLNKRRGALQNLARNRRSAAFNTYHRAQSASGEKRRRLLEKSARGFRQVLELIEAHGVAQPEKEQKQALIDIKIQTALDAGSATQAARGFSKTQEKRLAHAFLSRIALELGDLATARKDLEAQLDEYPVGAEVPEKDRYGVALLYHRAGLAAHALDDDNAAWDRFVYSARLCLDMQAPVGASVNMVNLAAVLEARLKNARETADIQSLDKRFRTLDRQVRRLLESSAAAAGKLRLAEYHNAMGVCCTLLAEHQKAGDAAAAVRQMRRLTRAAGHFTAGLKVLEENRLSPARKAFETKARLHPNLATVCRKTRDLEAARKHSEQALSTSRKALLPDLEWRALAGLGRLDEALAALSRVTPDRAGCRPMEILRAFGPLAAEELREAGPEAAFTLAEKIAELERFNRTAVFIQPRKKTAKAFYRRIYPRLSRIADYQNELDAAGPDQKPYIRERLEREKALLESETQNLPDFAARIKDPDTRHQVMRALGALLEAAETAEEIAVQQQRETPASSARERLQSRHEMLMADYRAAVSKISENGGQTALKSLFSPRPAGVMDAAASLAPGRRLLRLFPKGADAAGYILFTLFPDDITAQTIAHPDAVKNFLPAKKKASAACIAYEQPSALTLDGACPRVLSATHLFRAASSRKPFKQRLLEASRQTEIKALPEAFERLDWPSGEELSGPAAAYALSAAQTLVLPRRIAESADVPTQPGEPAEPFLAVYTDAARRMPLVELAARTQSLSLALIANPPKTERDRLIHLFSLYGCPTLILPGADTSSERSFDPARLNAFLERYAQMRAFDAALESLDPKNLLYLGDTGMSPEAAADYARKNFAGYVRAGRSAFDAGRYETALIQFSNAVDIAAQMDAFSRYRPALFQYARESAYKAGNLDKALAYARRLADLLEKRQPDSKAHAEALLTLGLIHSRLKHYDKAVPVIEAVVAMFAMLEADAQLAGAMTDLGIVLENATHYESALSRFQAAADLSQTLDNREMLAAQHINIGRIYDLRLNRYPEAIRHYEAALALYQTMQAPQKIAEARLDIGRCYRLLGVFVKAKRFYQEALKALDTANILDAQENENARLKTKILIEQANNAWFQGDF